MSVRQWATKQYWLGVIPALVVMMYRECVPLYLTNDPVRLVSFRRVFDPAFLSQEWLQLAGYDEDRLTILFKFLFAPLWLWLRNGILVGLTARLIVWAVVFYAMVRLARAMNVPRYALACGLFYWVYQGQTLGVSEWILGGAEGKCFAYAAIFLALESLLKGRRLLAAGFCGLAFWFHVPVGLWGVLAVYGAILFSRHEPGFKDVWQPALITLCVSLPMAWIAFKYADVSAAGGVHPDTDWLVVVFRNPHHLDPRHFGGWRIFIKLIACIGLTIFGLRYMLSPTLRRYFSGFLFILMLEFAFGLIARELGFYWYLKTYPFRVADVLVPLLFCLVMPKLVIELLSRASRSRYFASMSPTSKLVGSTLLVTILFGSTMVQSIRNDKFYAYEFATSWRHFLRHDRSPYQEMTTWIRTNTSAQAIFIAPPWMDDFPLEAERAPVVSFRRNPHNGLMVEWYRRYCAMNGGPFHSIGLDTEAEVQKNYIQLSQSQLEGIRKSYGGEYYLTTTKRDDLQVQLVHANDKYYLYRLTQ